MSVPNRWQGVMFVCKQAWRRGCWGGMACLWTVAVLPAAENCFTTAIGIRMVRVPAGEFLMGSTDAERDAATDEKPQHRVLITRPFYLAAHEVTIGQFGQFVAATAYQTDAEKDGRGGYGFDEELHWGQKAEYSWRNTGFPQTAAHPVVNVSYNDAMAFCDWLSRQEGKRYTLPSEAQWEYACRAGASTSYASGDDPESLAQVANVADVAAKQKFALWNTLQANDGYTFTAPVGTFKPNAFGLYDLHGNVEEWCADRYDPEYYDEASVEDPSGPVSGACRVSRGGGWLDSPILCRSARRRGAAPTNRDYGLGFRVCLPAAASE